MKRYPLLESLKRLVPELPRFNPAGVGAPLQFSSPGGGGRYDDPDDDYYDDAPEEQSRTPRRDRRDDPQATAARRRTVQSGPDDRYWTDYLRIALPVIGLLLVVAVFWYWAQQLIDDDNGDDLTATQPGLSELVDNTSEDPTPPSTPLTTQAGDEQSGAPAAPTATQPPAEDPQSESQPSPTPPAESSDPEAPGEEEVSDVLAGLTGASSGGEIAPDMTVAVSEEGGGLNLRSEPSDQGGEATVVTMLDAGTQLTVVSGPEQGGDFTWWEVVTDTGEQGWVVEDFIAPVE